MLACSAGVFWAGEQPRPQGFSLKKWVGRPTHFLREKPWGRGWRARATCSCSYCCNRHRCYDGGRLGRIKIVTLRVGARAKEGKRGGEGEKKIFSSLFLPPTPLHFDSPHFLPSFRVSTCAFPSKTFARPKKTRALQATLLLT